MYLCIYMYSWTLNSPLTNSSCNKGHDGPAGMRKNKQANKQKTQLQTSPKKKKNQKTTYLELIQISRAPSQPAAVFSTKNCMWYGTYLTKIKEREERNRQLQKGKKTIQKDTEKTSSVMKEIRPCG